MVALQEHTIHVSAVFHEIRTDQSGGIDVFVGTVRNHADGKPVDRLEYTAYRPMAIAMMEKIEADVRARWPVHRVILVHRVGTLAVGDVAVVAAVSAAHRAEAFEACRYAIERIKADVPIWKKEFAPNEAEGAWKANVSLDEGRAGGKTP